MLYFKKIMYLAISLHIIIFCFIYVFVCFSDSLLLLNSIPLYYYIPLYYSIIYITVCLLISPIDGYLVCFQFSDIFIIQFYFLC